MFIGTTAVQSAFTFGDLLDWMLILSFIFGGFWLIKKNNNKIVKAIGTLLTAAGFFLLLWLVFWQALDYIIY